MEHLLTQSYFGYTENMPLSKEEYQQLKNVLKILHAGLAIEEIYDLLIANYTEFEEEQLKITVQYTVRLPGYSESQQNRSRLNQRLLNFLSACRMYLDQFIQHLKEISSVETLDITSIKKLKEECRCQHIEYRFMETLRNYVQHKGLAIHLITHSYGDVDPTTPESERSAYKMDLVAESAILRKDGKFESKILDEIGNEIDLKATSRVYMECLGKIHEKVRDKISPVLKKAREHINNIMELYKKEVDNDTSCLCVATVLKSGRRKIDFNVMLEWDDVRATLQNKNMAPIHIASSFITSESIIARKSRTSTTSPHKHHP